MVIREVEDLLDQVEVELEEYSYLIVLLMVILLQPVVAAVVPEEVIVVDKRVLGEMQVIGKQEVMYLEW